jgi:hypothetical protein
MKNQLVLAMLVLSTVLAGCAYVPYARESKKKPREGGVISLKPDPREEDRQKANAMMMTNCGPGYSPKITEEGEVSVGQRTSGSANKNNNARSSGFNLGSGFSLGGGGTVPGETTNSVQETSDIREWQIAYVCEKNNK